MIESKVNKELEKKIDLYVNGILTTEEIDELWIELIQDGYYLDYMKSVVNLKAVIDQKEESQEKSKIFTFQKVARYAAAAAVFVIVSIAGILNYSSSGNEMVSPISDIGLDVVRDVTGISETVTSEVIRRAIRLATDGDVDGAVALLESELKESTDAQLRADIALSLGSIQYNSGDYAASIESFELVAQQEGINVLTLERSYWFLGNAYFQLERLPEAENTFQKAYELNGAYSRVAKTYIDALQNVR
ncbi:MAG: tetratricopeptide repeat protein [Balneolaceae bacterium]